MYLPEITGTVLQDAMTVPEAPSRTNATLVTFAPDGRNYWHMPKTRPVLMAAQGTGMIEACGKAARVLNTDDVAVVPPGVMHWHGALAGHLFAHVSFLEIEGPDNNDWLEPVDEAHYIPSKISIA